MWPHVPVAMYYDVPYVHIQPMLLDTYLRFPNSLGNTFFNPDGFHPTAKGQRLLADIMISYVEGVICDMDREEAGQDSDGWTREISFVGGGEYTTDKAQSFKSLVVSKDLPAYNGSKNETVETYALLSLPNATAVPPLALTSPMSLIIDNTAPDPASWMDLYTSKNLSPKPFCADANDQESPLTPKHNDGWSEMIWKNEKHFWVSDTVGATISVDIKVNEGR